MAVTTFDRAPNPIFFSDAVVFGRMTERVQAYLDRRIDDVPVEPKAPGLIETLSLRVSDYFARRAAVAQLERMSDAMLKDIGIERADISKVVAR
jgi:uncharacterized protein YjiS (DUF1127 family)